MQPSTPLGLSSSRMYTLPKNAVDPRQFISRAFRSISTLKVDNTDYLSVNTECFCSFKTLNSESFSNKRHNAIREFQTRKLNRVLPTFSILRLIMIASFTHDVL